MEERRPTWLITGASSGIGRSLALEALNAGFKVLGATRSISQAETNCPQFASRGGTWVELDPAQPDAYHQVVKVFQEQSIDVLVNNAGYAFIGSVEDASEEEFRAQMEVNFYGPLRTVRACLPAMRARGSGQIILISSGAGFTARPARGVYSASKFAIEAAHESLAQEVGSFGIKVLIVEPGAFRTPFASRIITPARLSEGFSQDYEGTVVEQMITGHQTMKSLPDSVKGDPDKAARAIIHAAVGGHDYLRLPLGTDCVAALELKIGELQHDLEATRAIAVSTDVE
ncbi:NAD(P)-binding protein [Aspergillus japonicus CBS 114.51]|uniref:NAD(P)-binding protein n=1 Tax=Aspergillus japonicus CBS 114.51 TaxID=1448312 RepID=A0A8T8XIR5_ASPJA|nr:NAD(P)-binding protein [Aspergillus japonicus CBS 114.51]RAH87389.1 NAD(P)-binding protein [Aspergillus japonicus CBS 114.51]